VLAAFLSILIPTQAFSSQGKHIRFAKVGVSIFLLFWIFIYPKKSLSPIICLPPLLWIIFRNPITILSYKRLTNVTLALLLAANCALSLRYHIKLSLAPGGRAELDNLSELFRASPNLPKESKVLGKLWLVFATGKETRIIDITIFPRLLRSRFSESARVNYLASHLDAAVLERQDGVFVDSEQDELATIFRSLGWREVATTTTRYFKPVDLVCFFKN
jgi:hypothetical protein